MNNEEERRRRKESDVYSLGEQLQPQQQLQQQQQQQQQQDEDLNNFCGSRILLNNAEELLEFIKKENIEEVDCCFADPLGQWHHCSFHPNAVQTLNPKP